MKLPTLNPPHAVAGLLAALALGQIASSVAACLSLVAAERRASGAHVAPAPLPAHETQMQLATNVQGAHLFGVAPAGVAGADAPASAAPSRGDFVLTGIIHINVPGKGIAIIARPDGHGAVYKVGQPLEADVSLRQVLTDAVLLWRDGKLERLTLPHGASFETLAASFRATRAAAPGTASEVGAASQEALASGTQSTLQAFGLSIVRDSAGSITGLTGRGAETWTNSGLLPTDVIVSIDGRPVGDVLQQPTAIDRSSQAAYTVLQVLRDGNPVTIEARPPPATAPQRPARRRSG